MNYITNLRKYIGHQPIINIGATVIVMNEHNELKSNCLTVMCIRL